MIVVVKKENDQCTKEIHNENYKYEQISINHLFEINKYVYLIENKTNHLYQMIIIDKYY